MIKNQGLGSSPLTRGKPIAGHARRMSERLIPAHAGKTRCLSWRQSRAEAHPRSRGENLSESMGVSNDEGSSPLTRGKHTQESCGVAPARLIPAHAGKTGRAGPQRRNTVAHPRSRGENVGRGFSRSVIVGSSPLTRGKLLFFTFSYLFCRLIPAHAGKTELTG